MRKRYITYVISSLYISRKKGFDSFHITDYGRELTFSQDITKSTNDETETFNFRLGTSF